MCEGTWSDLGCVVSEIRVEQIVGFHCTRDKHLKWLVISRQISGIYVPGREGLSVCTSACMSICTCLSACLPVYLYTKLFALLPVCMHDFPVSVRPLARLYAWLPRICSSTCLLVCLFCSVRPRPRVYMSVTVLVHLSVFLSFCSSVYLSLCLSVCPTSPYLSVCLVCLVCHTLFYILVFTVKSVTITDAPFFMPLEHP